MTFKLMVQYYCLLIAGFICFSGNAWPESATKFESKLLGRWVVDSDAMCTNPKFKDAGIYYFLDKSGKLTSELRLSVNGQIQVIRRSIYQSVTIFDQDNLVIKTVAKSENLKEKTTYTTTSLLQFSEDFSKQYLLDQGMDGHFNIRDGIVLVNKQKQSPFYRCEAGESAK